MPAKGGDSGSIPWEGNGNPLQHSCLGNPTDRRAWRVWGESKQAKMAWSGSLAPQPLGLALRFVNNVYVTAEIPGSTAHALHKALTWSRATLRSRPVRASPRKPWLLRHWGTLEWHHGYAIWGYVMAVIATLWLCCGCSFQPLSSRLAYPGFSEQCGQYELWDSWYHKQDQWYSRLPSMRVTKSDTP